MQRVPCDSDGISSLHVVATQATVQTLQAGATTLASLKTTGAKTFAFVSIVNLPNADEKDCVKVVCHLCDSSTQNAETFLNHAWRKRVASTSHARLTAMEDSGCVHALAIRRGKTDEMLLADLARSVSVEVARLVPAQQDVALGSADASVEAKENGEQNEEKDEVCLHSPKDTYHLFLCMHSSNCHVGPAGWGSGQCWRQLGRGRD